jgi:deoxyribodipyrimidine photo-lyase
MSGWNIIWHYRDLRIEDNPALTKASKGKVIPIYIHSPQEEGKWKSGSASNWWLHHSLKDLQLQYKKLGIHLVIKEGLASKVIEEIMSEISIEGIYWNLRYEPSLQKRDKKIAKSLESQGVSVTQCEGNYLITPSDFLNKSGSPYAVFTPFFNRVLEVRPWNGPLPAPKITGTHRIKSASIESLNLLPEHSWADQFSTKWTPGRGGAIDKLSNFNKKLDDYPVQRDIPSSPGTSLLSPHLHFGEISPHEIWKKIESNKGDSIPYLKQLIWREFSNYFLFHSPLASDYSWKAQFEDFPWDKKEKNLLAWQKGMTGYPIVDAGMRELWQTGWMHNRVRMIVGSFLVKDLFIHWKKGAEWFFETLVDADLANNTLGWQWVAGCGPDAAPYFRIFNPELQSKKFDPNGAYIRRWVPELKDVPAKWIHAPHEAPTPPSNYPPPIIDHKTARNKALNAYQKIK